VDRKIRGADDVWSLLLISGLFEQDSHAQTSDEQGMHMHHPTEESNGTAGTITGYVRTLLVCCATLKRVPRQRR
jgi:hypothetical protein